MNTGRKGLIFGGLVVALLVGVAGGTLMQVVPTNAQTVTPTAAPNQGYATAQKDESQATHVGSNGQHEQLLTGDSAQKVRDAALKAVPGGTIQRVETEVDGNGVYEAHMTKADGSRVTVYFDANYNLTSTQEGGMKSH